MVSLKRGVFSGDVPEMLCHAKAIKLYIALDGNYLTAAAKASDITYSHAGKLLSFFSGKGLVVRSDLDGRTKRCEYTQKGKRLAEMLCRVREVLA